MKTNKRIQWLKTKGKLTKEKNQYEGFIGNAVQRDKGMKNMKDSSDI